MNATAKIRASLILSALALLLASCMVQLAPRYDASLYDGITGVNTRIMELFATVAGGTDAASFAEREAAYNAIIGSVDALALQSRARPVPASELRERVNKFLDDRGQPLLDDDEAPSAAALEQVSKQLAKMKEVDRERGLGELVIPPFRNAVIISMDQAITYESFLER